MRFKRGKSTGYLWGPGTGPGTGWRFRPGFLDPDRRRTGHWKKHPDAPDRSPMTKTLYISGEESQGQIKMRSERIAPATDSCYILTETLTQKIFRQVEALQPDLLIVDSIQTLHSDYLDASPGASRKSGNVRQNLFVSPKPPTLL